jgi:hypothetical protein
VHFSHFKIDVNIFILVVQKPIRTGNWALMEEGIALYVRKWWYNILWESNDMKLLRTKIWKWWDVSLLKWSAFLFGIGGGAYFHEFVKPYLWIIIIVAVLAMIRPAIAYWKD